MAQAAQQIEITPPLHMRQFERPDLDTHGKWLLPRLLQTYPHLNDRSVANWLLTMLYNNEYKFLFQNTGVACAQVVSSHTLAPKPMIYERFVWIEDRKNVQQQQDAAFFYDEFYRWAKLLGADPIIVEEASDVPHEMIRARLGGRIFTREQKFARMS